MVTKPTFASSLGQVVPGSPVNFPEVFFVSPEEVADQFFVLLAETHRHLEDRHDIAREGLRHRFDQSVFGSMGHVSLCPVC